MELNDDQTLTEPYRRRWWRSWVL